jgi:DNA-directed RNA polymerase subunit E'/Rpb7
MQTITITKRVTIRPEKLTKKIKKHIIKQLEIDTENECSKMYGYILKIYNIEKIIFNEDTVLLVEFLAKTLKPEVNKVLETVVYKIYKDGIFVDILNKQKILIPSINITDFEFNEENSTYIHISDKNKEIKENDLLNVKIDAVKYNNGKFSCFGSLV